MNVEDRVDGSIGKLLVKIKESVRTNNWTIEYDDEWSELMYLKTGLGRSMDDYFKLRDYLKEELRQEGNYYG